MEASTPWGADTGPPRRARSLADPEAAAPLRGKEALSGASGVGRHFGPRTPATEGYQVMRRRGKGLLFVSLDYESGIRDHLEIGLSGLAFTSQVVTKEDRVRHVEPAGLETTEVDLTSTGDADLGVRKQKPEHGQDAEAPLGSCLLYTSPSPRD